MNIKPIDEISLKLPSFLYLITHNEFYSTMASYLRLHKTHSFRSLRAAIDSTFTAYYLIKHPDKGEIYLSKITAEDNSKWDSIFRNIKRTFKKAEKEFPLANNLMKIHELCSIYAHSDALGILHKYNEDKERGILQAKYFDYERNTDEYEEWFVFITYSFLQLFIIYWEEIFKKIAGNKLKLIESNIGEIKKRLDILSKKYAIKRQIIPS